MGSVWRASRSDGRFEGSAAVKLLNAALVGRAGGERFKREGTILARLTHPHIARLIDAGVSMTGQPYLVLEFIDGRHIDKLLRRGSARRRGAHPAVPRRAGRGGPCAREPDRPPRSEAVQRPGDARRPGQAAGLRHREAARRRYAGARSDADARSGRRPDPEVRRTRTGDARPDHHRDRRLRARRAALQPAHRAASGRPRAAVGGRAGEGDRRASSPGACQPSRRIPKCSAVCRGTSTRSSPRR